MSDPLKLLCAEHLNRHVHGITPSATVAINDLSNDLRREGREVFKLGLGQSPFPVPDPVVKALQRYAAEKDYLPVQGLQALREAVAAHHRRTFEIECDADQVLIGPGSKELMFLLQLTYAGDLIIPAPSWVSYAPQAHILGREVQWLPTRFEDGWQPSAEALDALCETNPGRPRLLILNYPSNPTGRTIPPEELRGLAETARKHCVLILSDEIYGKLHHEGEHQSIVPYFPEGTIFSGGLSKWCGAGGWRLGLFVFPKGLGWLQDSMAAVATETFTSTSAPIQHAAVHAFVENEEIERYLRQARRVLKGLGAFVARTLEGAGVRVLPPEGGFYLFPDFSSLADRLRPRGIENGSALCQRLLEDTGVAILPGCEFGQGDGDFTARIAYVDFDGGAALRAADAVPEGEPIGDRFVRAYCPRTVEAVERVAGWVTS